MGVREEGLFGPKKILPRMAIYIQSQKWQQKRGKPKSKYRRSMNECDCCWRCWRHRAFTYAIVHHVPHAIANLAVHALHYHGTRNDEGDIGQVAFEHGAVQFFKHCVAVGMKEGMGTKSENNN